MQNNGAQQLASEATVYIMLEDVNDEIPLFTEREQETVLEGEPIGTKVTQVNAIDKDGTFPNNQVCIIKYIFVFVFVYSESEFQMANIFSCVFFFFGEILLHHRNKHMISFHILRFVVRSGQL